MKDDRSPLDQLVTQAKAAGAEGILLLRGLSSATLAHTFAAEPGVESRRAAWPPALPPCCCSLFRFEMTKAGYT
jgi:hypothetical protein